MSSLQVLAPAKINLFLSVGPRRGDGLHEIVSVMQSVSLFDELTLDPAEATSLQVDPPDTVPTDHRNLVLRALRTFAALQGRDEEVGLGLRKRIPVAAGLAGGSADAAATLVGLNELWGTAVSRKSLEKIGASIGADVPFCVRGGTAAVRGAGEDLSALAVRAPVWWVLATSDLALSTADVYAEHDRLGGSRLGDPYEVADALARGDCDRLAAALHNDLQAAALSLAPSIEQTGDALRTAGALAAIVSGSGPTWVGLARDEAHAREIAEGVDGARVEVVCSVARGARVKR